MAVPEAQKGGLSRLIQALLVVLTLLYPLAVFAGLQVARPGVLGVVLALLALLRMGVAGPQGVSRAPVWGILAYSVVVVVTDSEIVLRFYPVLINAMMLALFVGTLHRGPPMIERIARARGMPISAAGIRYLRTLTKAWCVFFVVNGAIAAATALYASLSVWALYNGLLAYVFMGAFFAVELVVRRRYRARHGADDEPDHE